MPTAPQLTAMGQSYSTQTKSCCSNMEQQVFEGGSFSVLIGQQWLIKYPALFTIKRVFLDRFALVMGTYIPLVQPQIVYYPWFNQPYSHSNEKYTYSTSIANTIDSVHYKESKQASICLSSTHHELLMENFSKCFPLPNISALQYICLYIHTYVHIYMQHHSIITSFVLTWYHTVFHM